MKACAPIFVATWTKLEKEVPHVQVFVRLLFEAQWYSSESEPPGKRIARVPISVSREIVVALSKLVSQIAVFTLNIRASTVRTACVAFTPKCTSAGAGLAVS